MAQSLSQEEIDALMQGIATNKVEVAQPQPGQAEASPQAKPQAPKDDLKPYDFSRSEISTRGRLPGLEIVFNKFARRLHSIFSSKLGKSVDAGFEAMDVVLYEDLIKRIPLPSSIHVVRLDPLRGLGLFGVEAHLAYAMVDIFFGGTGTRSMKVEGRDFTPIETNFMGKFVMEMLHGMEEAWEGVIPLKGQYLRSEINPYLLGASGMGDVMVMATYKIDMAQVAGDILFALPLSAIEEVRDRLKSTAPMSDMGDGSFRARLRKPLLGVDLSVSAVVDVVDLTVREIMSLRPGDLIQVNPQGLEEATLWVEGIAKFAGKGVQKNGNKVFVVSGRLG